MFICVTRLDATFPVAYHGGWLNVTNLFEASLWNGNEKHFRQISLKWDKSINSLEWRDFTQKQTLTFCLPEICTVFARHQSFCQHGHEDERRTLWRGYVTVHVQRQEERRLADVLVWSDKMGTGLWIRLKINATSWNGNWFGCCCKQNMHAGSRMKLSEKNIKRMLDPEWNKWNSTALATYSRLPKITF